MKSGYFDDLRVLQNSYIHGKALLLHYCKWAVLGIQIAGYFPIDTKNIETKIEAEKKKNAEKLGLISCLRKELTLINVYPILLIILCCLWVIRSVLERSYSFAFLAEDGPTRGTVFLIVTFLSAVTILHGKIYGLIHRKSYFEFWNSSANFLFCMSSFMNFALESNPRFQKLQKRSFIWFAFLMSVVIVQTVFLSITFTSMPDMHGKVQFFDWFLHPFFLAKTHLHIYCTMWYIHMIRLYKLGFILIYERVIWLKNQSNDKKKVDFDREINKIITFYCKVEDEVNFFNYIWGVKFTLDFCYPLLIVLLQLFSVVSIFISVNSRYASILKFGLPGIVGAASILMLAMESGSVWEQAIDVFSGLEKFCILKNIQYDTYQKVSCYNRSQLY